MIRFFLHYFSHETLCNHFSSQIAISYFILKPALKERHDLSLFRQRKMLLKPKQCTKWLLQSVITCNHVNLTRSTDGFCFLKTKPLFTLTARIVTKPNTFVPFKSYKRFIIMLKILSKFRNSKKYWMRWNIHQGNGRMKYVNI